MGTTGGWGCGTTMLGKVKAEELGEALKKVCGDPGYIERTQKLKLAMDKEDGNTRSCEIIESFLRDEIKTGKWKERKQKEQEALTEQRKANIKMSFEQIMGRWNVK